MNQYDSSGRKRIIQVGPHYERAGRLFVRAVYFLLASTYLLCQPASAQNVSHLPSVAYNSPCVPKTHKHHWYAFWHWKLLHHKHHNDPDCQKIVSSALPALPTSSPAPRPPSPPEWVLYAGHPIGQELIQWGQESGWRVIWNPQQDWLVPNTTVFHGSFTNASSQVLEDLAAEGAPIHGIFYQGNQTLVITGGTP